MDTSEQTSQYNAEDTLPDAFLDTLDGLVAEFQSLLEGRDHKAWAVAVDTILSKSQSAPSMLVAMTLARLGEKTLPHLLELSRTADPDTYGLIVGAISRMEPAVVPELLRRLLEEPDDPLGGLSEVSEAIIAAIVMMEEQAIPPLIDYLTVHHSLFARSRLTPLLGKIASDVGMRAFDLLLEAANEVEKELLPDIGFALERIGDEAVTRLLDIMARGEILGSADRAEKALLAMGETPIDASIQAMVEYKGDDRFVGLVLGYGLAALPYLQRAHARLEEPAARSKVSLVFQGIRGNAIFRGYTGPGKH